MTTINSRNFEYKFGRKPSKTETLRFYRGTLLKYTVDQVFTYKDLLPNSFYNVMLLWAEGKSYQQIANELNIPIGTVKSRVNRSSKKIDQFKKVNELAATF